MKKIKPPIDFESRSDVDLCLTQYDRSRELKTPQMRDAALLAWIDRWGLAITNQLRIVKPPRKPAG